MREDRQRLDKWLWYARFARTRTACAKLVEDGRVRLNGTRIKQPSKGIAAGDVLTVAAEHGTIVARVTALGERRGNADAARALYEAIDS
ncbi:MAG: ribosome-associated heat shock protein Hsp15 HslR [Saliniramus fredricksonii]|uniref:Heat shock protein Hsp15 n=1 Tax=Saliniramus fredricksonii TaxID=1653334 RepID=A0A0P8A9M5_9HYPH|nr:RNA-binding S4 domain-containing protein [Saliniramus fredricksonii]KPQ11785.1 MAG: ribosome-associated heat shock protein Hsp15 HslR [Saliniramus fredricksonii]SCC82290.1 heat shock protein Hsp15 [Saliniramus fredricksonii]